MTGPLTKRLSLGVLRVNARAQRSFTAVVQLREWLLLMGEAAGLEGRGVARQYGASGPLGLSHHAAGGYSANGGPKSSAAAPCPSPSVASASCLEVKRRASGCILRATAGACSPWVHTCTTAFKTRTQRARVGVGA